MQAEIDKAKDRVETEGLLLQGGIRQRLTVTGILSTSPCPDRNCCCVYNPCSRVPGKSYVATQALLEAQVGYDANATQMARNVSKGELQPRPKKTAALALALSGEKQLSSQLASELDREMPLDTLTQNYHLPMIRAATYLQKRIRKKPLKSWKWIPYRAGRYGSCISLPRIHSRHGLPASRGRPQSDCRVSKAGRSSRNCVQLFWGRPRSPPTRPRPRYNRRAGSSTKVISRSSSSLERCGP